MSTHPTTAAGAADLYDRQIRLWGPEAQHRLMTSHVLFVGMTAIHVEAAKNLVLAGVNVSLCDQHSVDHADLGFNFLITKQALGKQRAEASSQGLRAMNSLVNVTAVTDSFDHYVNDPERLCGWVVDQGITAVCVAAEQYPLFQLQKIDNALRVQHTAVMVSLCCGKFGFIFADACCHHPTNCEKLDESHVCVDFPSLSDMLGWQLSAPIHKRTRPIVYTYLLLIQFEMRYTEELEQIYRSTSSFPSSVNHAALSTASHGEQSVEEEIAERFVSFGIEQLKAAGIVTQGKPYDEELFGLREMMLTYKRPFCITASALGGILAQEVRKFVCLQMEALCNVIAFSGNASCATVERVPPIQ